MNILFNYYELPRQGSNLDFPDPESGVLPVTPRGNFAFLEYKNIKLFPFIQMYANFFRFFS